MRAYHEELFGPVAVVHRVDDEDEAVALANDSPFGLGGIGVLRRRRARAPGGGPHRERDGLHQPSGDCRGPSCPFGGIKRSGYGRELADLGMQEFANRKLVCVVDPDAPLGSFAG